MKDEERMAAMAAEIEDGDDLGGVHVEFSNLKSQVGGNEEDDEGFGFSKF